MYSKVFELHADLLKALAHPRRLEIIQLLRENEHPVTDIHTMLDLPQANISQHLMILKNAGVLVSRRDGKQIFYQLADKKVCKACDLLREVIIDTQEDPELTQQVKLKMKDLLPIVHDPVCGMRLSPKTAGYQCFFNGKEYYFCAGGCLKSFQKGPESYV